MKILYKKKKSKKGLKYKKGKKSKDRTFEEKMNREGSYYHLDKVPYMPM